MISKLLSGLIIGLLLGLLLRSSRFCLTGCVRDIYLEKKKEDIALFFGIVSVEGMLYQLLVFLGVLRVPYFPPFSLLSIALGGFLFGLGAVLAGGCVTQSLVKCGDGRSVGWIALAAFCAAGYLVSAGPANLFTYRLQGIALVYDSVPGRGTIAPFLICCAGGLVCLMTGLRARRSPHSAPSGEPLRSAGKRLLLPVLLGLLLGAAFFVSDRIGRHYGVAIAMPVLSFVFAVTHPDNIIGGCNVYDQKFGFGSMLVLGVLLGSLAAALLRKEWTLVPPSRKTALRAAAGGAVMGLGAIWGQGCLLANGLVGTAQFSAKSWYALLFLTAGIFTGAKLFLLTPYRKKQNRHVLPKKGG